MSKTTTGHYNVYRHNDAATVAHDIRLLMRGGATVFTLNEVQRKHIRQVKRVLNRNGWSWDRKRANAICWNADVWEKVGKKRWVRLCKKASIPVHPARFLLSRDLEYRRDRSLHTIHCTHLPQGYAKKDGTKPAKIAAAEDEQAREAVANLDHTLAEEIKQRPAAYHHLSGDMNARIANRDEKWYPGVALADQWDLNNAPQNSIDWQVFAKASVKRGLRVLRTWVGTKKDGFHSDHPAHFTRLEW